MLSTILLLGQILLNWSFEGPVATNPPPDWATCSGSPDTEPGAFPQWTVSSFPIPIDGNSFLGLLFLNPTLRSSESVSQHLTTSIIKDTTYNISVYLSNYKNTVGGLNMNTNYIFEVYLSNSSACGCIFYTSPNRYVCNYGKLVWQSDSVTNVNTFARFHGSFKPDSNYSYIKLVINSNKTTGSTYALIDSLTIFAPGIVLGTEENGIKPISKSSIIFYPNPAKEVLNYESVSDGELVLQDALGRIVKNVGIRDRNGTISLSQLSSGTYSYHFTTQNTRVNGKVMVE